MERGFDAPDWYVEEPPIDERDYFFLEAFRDLGTTRAYGMTLGPIPWDKIVEYATLKNLDDESRDILIEIIGRMDAAYLDWNAKAMKAKIPTPT